MKRFKDWSIRSKLTIPLFAVMVLGGGGITLALLEMHDEIMNDALLEERALDGIRRASLQLLSEYHELMLGLSETAEREIDEFKEEIEMYEADFAGSARHEDTEAVFVEAIDAAAQSLKRIGDDAVDVRFRLLDHMEAMESFKTDFQLLPAGAGPAEDRQGPELDAQAQKYISELREYVLSPNDATRREIAEIERYLEGIVRAHDDRASEPGGPARDRDAGEFEPVRQLLEAGRATVALTTEFLAKRDALEGIHNQLLTVLDKAGTVIAQETDRAFESGFTRVAGLILAVLAMLTLICFYVSERIAMSVTVLANAADRFGNGDLKARAGVAGEDEIGGLAAAFNNMAATLESNINHRKHAEEALLTSEHALQARFAELGEAHRKLEMQSADLVRLADHLFVARDAAAAADRAKSQFLAAMSHELRTPLNAVIGFSEIIKDEIFGPVSSVRYRDYAGDIHESGRHLLSLVNDILDLSKIESGRDELHEGRIEIPEIVGSALKLVGQRAEQGGIELDLDLPDRLPALRADERRLKQILVNLLSNAIKFTDTGGAVTLRVRYRMGSGYVFQIVDNGIGMAPKDIPKALSRFGQVDGGLSRKYEGTGLGLPLTKALVELHGGTLDLRSDFGVGTTVTVRFPAGRIVAPLDNGDSLDVEG